MKSYASYANNYEKAMQTIQHLKKTNKKFVKFLALCDKKEVCRHHTIEDFLIIVIQRIPRYVMLLTDLLKNTPSDHEDFDSLTKATGKIKDVAEYVNTAKRNVELMQHGINIQHDLGIKDIPPARSFIAEGSSLSSVVS
jgi:6-phosphogluconate dehydrogenase